MNLSGAMVLISLLALVLLVRLPLLFPRASFSLPMAIKVLVLGMGLLSLLALMVL